MNKLNLIEYVIEGEDVHCTVDIFIAGKHSFTLDTGSKYKEVVEEELAITFGRIFKELLKNVPNDEHIRRID